VEGKHTTRRTTKTPALVALGSAIWMLN